MSVLQETSRRPEMENRNFLAAEASTGHEYTTPHSPSENTHDTYISINSNSRGHMWWTKLSVANYAFQGPDLQSILTFIIRLS